MSERIPQLSVVVPARNEELALSALVEAIRVALKDEPWELIIVDDGSSDGSKGVLRKLVENDNRLKAVFLPEARGKGAALEAGILQARASWIVTSDADLQEAPAEISRLREKQKAENFDLVVAWRASRKDGVLKSVASFILNQLCRWMLKSPVHDLNCGLKLIRRDLARSLSLRDSRFRFMVVQAVRLGARVGEIPVEHHHRVHGKSRFGIKRYLDTAIEFAHTFKLYH